jgi:hypothetical protein
VIVDLSSNNGHPINYLAAKEAGVTGAIIKATDGTGYRNPDFATDVNGFVGVGVPTVGYHFAEFRSPQAEAAWFISVAGSRARVLDSETNTNIAWQNAFLTALGLPGNEELDYGSASTLPRSGIRSMLWPASYGKSYGFGDCWQYTDSLAVNGIPGRVDASQWIGPQAHFDALFSLTPAPPAPGPINLAELLTTMDTRDPSSNGTWIIDPTDGHVEAIDGAPYCGALNEPMPDRYGWKEQGYISGITSWLDPGGTGWGYKILVRRPTPLPNGQYFTGYTFRRTGTDKSKLDKATAFD